MKDYNMKEEFNIVCYIIGAITYVLTTIHGWNSIYHTDLMYNNITIQVTNNDTTIISEKLLVDNTFVYYGAILGTIIIMYVCFINNLCRRYYLLWFSYAWCSLVFLKIMLIFHWTTHRFDSNDGYANVVPIPDDSYLEYVNNILIKSIIYIPICLYSYFICRHFVNYIRMNNIHINVPKRYPHKCDEIFQASMYDMYEIFLIPVMHTCYVLFIIVIICCVCMDNNEVGHFETNYNASENSQIIEKEIGFMKLETLYEKQNIFDRMI